jgi:putative membrane protein
MTYRALKLGGGLMARLHLDVRVEGLEHVPATGPALIVARHFHHLYDGCLFEARLPRPVHILVGLDWVRGRLPRLLIEGACRAAEWPVLLRRERLEQTQGSAFRPDEVRPYLRRALHDSAALLRAGQVLAVFPEAYPTIDPAGAVKTGADAFLPFRPGFERIVALAERDRHTRVPILPTGFHYVRAGARWQVTLHIGEPIFREAIGSAPQVIAEVERRVRLLSAPLPTPAPQPVDRALLVNPDMRKGLET